VPSSPKDLEPESESEIQMKCIRKLNPPLYDPASYVSSQDKTAKIEAAKCNVQSHISYAFKTTMTMWSKSVQIEPRSYEEAVNHSIYVRE